MTLLIALSLKEHTVLVSDRRVTMNGRLVDDRFNKAATVILRDARLAVAFAGMAAVGARAWGAGPAPRGTHNTSQFLLEALTDCAPPEHTLQPLLDRLQRRTTRVWNQLRVPSRHKAVEFLFAGYENSQEGCRPFVATLTNFEDGGRSAARTFRIEVEAVRPGYVMLGGLHQAVPEDRLSAFTSWRTADTSPAAAVERTVHLVQKAREMIPGRDLIGGDCSAIILPADPNQPVAALYVPERSSPRIYGVNHVEARGGDFGVFSTMDPEMWAEDQAGIPHVMVVKKVGRNKLCPCGSGRKYKHCHGS